MQKACRVKGRRQAQRGTTLFCRGRRRALRPRRDNGLVPGPAYWPFSGAAREGIPRAVRSGFQPGAKNVPAAFSGTDELSGIVSFIADGRNYIIEETGLQAIQALRAAGLSCRVMVGGAVLSQEYADMIGADFYSKDAMGAVHYALEVTKAHT